MKVAIIHDDLMRRGGAEQVVLSILKAFPNSDFYTLCYDPKNAYPEYMKYDVKTTWFQHIAKDARTMQRLFFPLGVWAMKSLNLKEYDVVLISTTFAAKFANIAPSTLIFNYTYTPFRLVWNPNSYTQYNNSKGLHRKIFDVVINYLKRIDVKAARKANYFIGMTTETAQRIKDAYRVSEVKIIKPDVKTRNFYVSNKPKQYYLLVSRLEYYKKVDLAVAAFNELGLKLIIVGNGTKANELKASAKENIEFRKGLSSEELADLYANAKGFIFPQHEDYGITPLEANAAGTPVIAYSKGGVLETMIPYTGDASKATALFFHNQTVISLIEAIKEFDKLSFNPDFIRAHAEKFDEQVFINELREFVETKYAEHKHQAVLL